MARMPAIGQPLGAQFHDAFGCAGQLLGGGVAQENQDIRGEKLDLALDERLAHLHLFRRGRAVAGRTPEDEVRDVDIGLGEVDRGKHPVEKLSCPADERLALRVLVLSGRFSDQHEARLRRSARETQARGGLLQPAAVEPLQQ